MPRRRRQSSGGHIAGGQLIIPTRTRRKSEAPSTAEHGSCRHAGFSRLPGFRWNHRIRHASHPLLLVPFALTAQAARQTVGRWHQDGVNVQFTLGSGSYRAVFDQNPQTMRVIAIGQINEGADLACERE